MEKIKLSSDGRVSAIIEEESPPLVNSRGTREPSVRLRITLNGSERANRLVRGVIGRVAALFAGALFRTVVRVAR